MAMSVQVARMFIAVQLIFLGVSTVHARVYFSGEDDAKPGMLGLTEYDLGAETKANLSPGGQEEPGALFTDLNPNHWQAVGGVLQPRKRSLLPGARSRPFGKQYGYWLNPLDASNEDRWAAHLEKRQLWDNQQSGLFGKRTLPRWAVKRPAEDGSDSDREEKKASHHIFNTGGIFGKRSTDNWETR